MTVYIYYIYIFIYIHPNELICHNSISPETPSRLARGSPPRCPVPVACAAPAPRGVGSAAPPPGAAGPRKRRRAAPWRRLRCWTRHAAPWPGAENFGRGNHQFFTSENPLKGDSSIGIFKEVFQKRCFKSVQVFFWNVQVD